MEFIEIQRNRVSALLSIEFIHILHQDIFDFLLMNISNQRHTDTIYACFIDIKPLWIPALHEHLPQKKIMETAVQPL